MTKEAKPEPELRVYTLEAAAEVLGLEPVDLYQLCLDKTIRHTDLGEGTDAYDGTYHEHLIRFSGADLDLARAQIAEL
jgi:hypothetical protein